MPKLKVFSLNGCGFSQNAEKLLNENNIDYSLIKIDYNEKESVKKQNNMNTFPQIFLETNNDKIKIGGFSELKQVYTLINNMKDLDDLVDKLKITISNSGNKNIYRLINILKKT